MKHAIATISLLLLLSCSLLDSADYFPLAVGNQWVLQDQRTQALTTFTIAERVNDLLPLRITKNSRDAYNAPGLDRSIDFFLQRDSDGTIWSPLCWTYFADAPTPGQKPDSVLVKKNSRASEPRMNYIVGPLAIAGKTVATHYSYTADGATWPEGLWKSIYTTKRVDTPVYKGNALCARYSEGTDAKENNAEEWCFAPNIGIVQLTYLFDLDNPNPDMLLKTISYHVAK